MKSVMEGWFRRGLTAALCGALVAGNVGVTAFAQEGIEAVENMCGPEATWELAGGTLTISGTGDMDYYYADQGYYAPWYEQRGSITSVVVEDGITGIGDFAFYDCPNLKEVSIPAGLEIIGHDAFANCWALMSVSVPGVSPDGAGHDNTAVIPEGVFFVGADAFYGCGQLRDVYFLAEDYSQYMFDTENDAQTWRYDFSNPYGTKIHVPVTAALGDIAFANVWNQQNSWQPPVTADIAAEGVFTVNVRRPDWGGTVTADKSGAAEGEEVLLTVTADEGLAETVSVSTGDGAAIPVEDLGGGQYSFVMPAQNVTVSVAYAQAFMVTVREAEHGTVAVSKDRVPAGGTVAVEAAADAGYVLDRVEFVQYGNIVALEAAEDGKYYFEMPWADAEVMATFAKGGAAEDGYHQIAVKNDYVWAGTFTVDSASATEGETVSGNVNMTNDSYAGVISVYDAAGEAVAVAADEDGAYSFVMPGSDVTVEMQLASYAYIAAEQTEGGIVTVEKEKVIAGDIAYVTAEPDDGYVLETILYNGYGALNTEADGTYSFEVPSWGGSYSVKAAFVKDDSGEELPAWTYADGTLTINAADCMREFEKDEEAPWDEYKDSVETVIVADGVAGIGAWAFDEYPVLKNVVLPDTVAYIGDNAFLFCPELEAIDIPDSVTVIGSAAFYYCTALAEVKLPASLVSVGSNAFGACTSLAEIVLPDGLEEIGVAAFQSCAALTVIEVPASVVTIGEDAFYGCYAVSDVYFHAADFSGYGFEPFDAAEAFAGSGMTKIHIPAGIDPSLLTSETGNDIYVWYAADPANVVNDIA